MYGFGKTWLLSSSNSAPLLVVCLVLQLWGCTKTEHLLAKIMRLVLNPHSSTNQGGLTTTILTDQRNWDPKPPPHLIEETEGDPQNNVPWGPKELQAKGL